MSVSSARAGGGACCARGANAASTSALVAGSSPNRPVSPITAATRRPRSRRSRYRTVARCVPRRMEKRFVAHQTGPERRRARRQWRQQYEAEQGRRIARRLEPLDLRDHASQGVVGHRPCPHDLSWSTAREPQHERSLRVRRLHATAGARDDQAGRDGAKRLDIEGCSRREAQGRDAQRGEIVVPQEQTEQLEQVGDAVVYRRRRDQQHARADDERSEEHTSELQSPCNLVCRLLLEKKKNKKLANDDAS